MNILQKANNCQTHRASSFSATEHAAIHILEWTWFNTTGECSPSIVKNVSKTNIFTALCLLNQLVHKLPNYQRRIIFQTTQKDSDANECPSNSTKEHKSWYGRVTPSDFIEFDWLINKTEETYARTLTNNRMRYLSCNLSRTSESSKWIKRDLLWNSMCPFVFIHIHTHTLM